MNRGTIGTSLLAPAMFAACSSATHPGGSSGGSEHLSIVTEPVAPLTSIGATAALDALELDVIAVSGSQECRCAGGLRTDT